MGGTLGETRLGVKSDSARSRLMELETPNELSIKSSQFYLKINPVEIEHSYYSSFLADIECIIYTFNQTQFQYTGDIWFSFDDFNKFVTELQNIVAVKIEQAQLTCINQFALLTIYKNNHNFKVCIHIQDDTAEEAEKTTLTTSFIEEYDFINILSRSVTEFWRNFKHSVTQ